MSTLAENRRKLIESGRIERLCENCKEMVFVKDLEEVITRDEFDPYYDTHICDFEMWCNFCREE